MTHMRPRESQSMRIGSSTMGSLATSSTRYPGGREKVFISSSGDRTDASESAGLNGGSHCLAPCRLLAVTLVATIARSMSAVLFSSSRLRWKDLGHGGRGNQRDNRNKNARYVNTDNVIKRYYHLPVS